MNGLLSLLFYKHTFGVVVAKSGETVSVSCNANLTLTPIDTAIQGFRLPQNEHICIYYGYGRKPKVSTVFLHD